LRLKQHLVERSEPPWFAGGGAGDFVFIKDRFEQLGGRKRGIHQKSGYEPPAAFRFFRKDLQSGVQQGGFAGSDRPSYDSETLALKNALEKDLESCAMRIRQVKKTRVRREAKWLFLQLVKGRVQTAPPMVPDSMYKTRQTNTGSK
jgi:hypothetical protein